MEYTSLMFIISEQVIADLPLGENLQSHVGTAEVAFVLEEPVSIIHVYYF
jgi:hypothetical protein